jgi:ketosteroid isomerase-like protein
VERVAADGHDRPDQEEAEMDSQAAARRWAATWTAAWQAHDVEAVVDPNRQPLRGIPVAGLIVGDAAH